MFMNKEINTKIRIKSETLIDQSENVSSDWSKRDSECGMLIFVYIVQFFLYLMNLEFIR